MSKKSKKQRLFTTPIVEKPPHVGEVPGSDSAKQVQFLAAYAILGAVGKAAKAAGCDRRSHIYWLANDADYPARFADAQATANEALEIECRRRAERGVERMKFYKGEPIMDPRTGKPYIEHEYSDTLLAMLLKAHLPDKYVDRVEQKNIDGGQDLPEATKEIMSNAEVRKALLAAEREAEDKRTADP
jgi:hypothetical protein